MKELLIAEMKRAIELFGTIEEKQKKFEIELEEREKLKAEKDELNIYRGCYYVLNTSLKDRAELKKILKMIRLHSVELEKQMKDSYKL